VNGELEKYQRKLGTPPRRPHLSVIKSYDLEPVQQPDETTRWARVQTSPTVVIGCVVASLVFALLSWLFAGRVR
jgi:hypothetical protein